jgi:chemotaxis protein methyltransferase CheR
MHSKLIADELARVSIFIADAIGLHYPEQKWPDLQRGITTAAKEFGHASSSECVNWLLRGGANSNQLYILANHLTVGETYFFREPRSFEFLAQQTLPDLLMARRRSHDRRLRIWSAACCSGE